MRVHRFADRPAYSRQRPYNHPCGHRRLCSGDGSIPETTGAPHIVFSIAIFVFGAVSAIISYRVLRPPLSYVSVGLGIIALVALVLMLTLHDLGIGPGGMERVIAYPIFLWALGFGGSLIGA
jgi:hypothetical membrane protein